MSVTKQLMDSGSHGLVTHILQNMSFYVQQKKEIRTGLEQLESE